MWILIYLTYAKYSGQSTPVVEKSLYSNSESSIHVNRITLHSPKTFIADFQMLTFSDVSDWHKFLTSWENLVILSRDFVEWTLVSCIGKFVYKIQFSRRFCRELLTNLRSFAEEFIGYCWTLLWTVTVLLEICGSLWKSFVDCGRRLSSVLWLIICWFLLLVSLFLLLWTWLVISVLFSLVSCSVCYC